MPPEDQEYAGYEHAECAREIDALQRELSEACQWLKTCKQQLEELQEENTTLKKHAKLAELGDDNG